MAFFDQDFFDELTDKLASAGKMISGKAKEVTDSAKTSLQIAQEEKKLRGAYRQLGMYIYEKSGIAVDDALAPYFDAISAAKLNIVALKSAEVKGETCQETDEDDCDEEDSVVEEVIEEVAEAVEEVVEPVIGEAERVCGGCKSVVSSQLIYCPKCGAKLK